MELRFPDLGNDYYYLLTNPTNQEIATQYIYEIEENLLTNKGYIERELIIISDPIVPVDSLYLAWEHGVIGRIDLHGDEKEEILIH